MIDNETIQLFGAKAPDGTFYAERIVDDLNKTYRNLEYDDVRKGEYQIWEYPSGQIFQIKPDREVGGRDLWSAPAENLWMPMLAPLEIDKEKVARTYERLSRK